MQHNSQDYFDIKDEKRQARRDRLMLAAGMSNFFSVIAGAAFILLLILLIFSLLNWLNQDIQSSFALFFSRF
ncbi:MAG: hypothetical protein GX781_05310 [Clostridiales bacterium]|nr:hypothetical protein [Clostridiales bacterium]